MCREILNMYKIMRNNCKSKRENLEFWDLSEWFALTEIKSIVMSSGVLKNYNSDNIYC